MAANSSDSNLIHRIGEGSTYDIDMDLIERFVESFQYLENKINRDALKFYYVGALYSYWDKLKKYLNSTQPEKDIATPVQFNRLDAFNLKPKYSDQKLTLSNLANMRTHLLQLENEFEKMATEIAKSEFSLDQIRQAFYFMSNLFCLRSLNVAMILNIKDLVRGVYDVNVGSLTIDTSFEEYYATHRDKFYPLPNDTGFFTPNTYLYAFFQGVEIIGIPNQNNDIEGSDLSCAVPFIYHDFDHHFRIWMNLDPEIIEGWKSIYYRILSDENLTRTKKELHILFLFIGLHEIINSHDGFYSNDPGLEALPIGVVKEYASEFEKFAKELPVFDSELIQYLFNMNISFEQSGDMTDEWRIENWEDLKKVWDLPDYRPLILYLLLAAYSVRYVRENYL